MTTHQTLTTEVLGPPLTKGEARTIETRARRRFRTGTRNLVQFAADLRRLQDGQAHLVRGFDNFGKYAAVEFDGLTMSAAKQLSRQGKVLLVLEAHDRIDLDGRGANLPGTTGLRQLSAVLGVHGEQIMLDVWDKAVTLRPGRVVVDADVIAAMHELIAPEPVPELTGPEAEEPDEPELPDEMTDEQHEARDRAGELLRLILNLQDAIEDGKSTEAERAYAEALDELPEVRKALDAIDWTER